MTATADFVATLESLKVGDLGLLRAHSGRGLDESVTCFDLFAGLWWPLRQKSERAPRRDVAWLIAKLYAVCPGPNAPASFLAAQLGRHRPRDLREQERFDRKFDLILLSPVKAIEPALRWGLAEVATQDTGIDWVSLTDDLSRWERESTRLRWAEEYLRNSGRR